MTTTLNYLGKEKAYKGSEEDLLTKFSDRSSQCLFDRPALAVDAAIYGAVGQPVPEFPHGLGQSERFAEYLNDAIASRVVTILSPADPAQITARIVSIVVDSIYLSAFKGRWSQLGIEFLKRFKEKLNPSTSIPRVGRIIRIIASGFGIAIAPKYFRWLSILDLSMRGRSRYCFLNTKATTGLGVSAAKFVKIYCFLVSTLATTKELASFPIGRGDVSREFFENCEAAIGLAGRDLYFRHNVYLSASNLHI